VAEAQQIIKQRTSDLMNHQLTRAEFLAYVGAALIGVAGIGNFLKHLNNIAPSQSASAKAKTNGYGSSAYGR